MIAVMYNRKKPIAAVEMENGIVKKVCDVINREYAPVLLRKQFTAETLNSWIGKRRMPAGREGLSDVSSRFRFFRSYPEFVSHGSMFSLSDQYWFCFDRQSQTWESGNYFTNPYSEDVGRAFFTPWEYPGDHAFAASPDLMTNGLLCKRWTRGEDGASYLIKAGSRPLHQEPISEVLASIMLRKLNILPFVEYELVVEGMRLCSKCRNFVTGNTEFVPASHIYFQGQQHPGESVYGCLLRMCKVFGINDAKKYIDKMIVADLIIGNEDRHLGNFGFIRDVKTQKFSFAPLFDSGYSFVPGSRVPNEQDRKKIIFNEKEKTAALMHNLDCVDLDKLEDHDEMFDLIDVYPELDDEQRRYIKKKIISAPGNIRQLIRTRDRAPTITR